eukprot:scaffold240898_cov32-Tisochrysis_lutea.AAC.1
MADNDIYGAWQAAARHLPWVLLDFDALPVHKYTLLAHKAPCLAVTACGVGADDGLGVLELLLDVTDLCVCALRSTFHQAFNSNQNRCGQARGFSLLITNRFLRMQRASPQRPGVRHTGMGTFTRPWSKNRGK